MYLDYDFKLVTGWRTPRWAKWAVNPDASPEARAAIEQLLAFNRTLRRLSWIVTPLQLVKVLSAGFAVIGGFAGLFGILLSRFFWHRGELEDESLLQQISDSPLFWSIFGATVLAISLHGLVTLIIGPIEAARKALIDSLVLPDFRALRPTPRIEEFKVPESVPEKLAWETAGLLVVYDSVATRAAKLGEILASSRAHHLSTEEQQIQEEQQEALEQMQARRAELATQLADAFRAVERSASQESS